MKDMYGHPIIRLDGGWGVSVTVGRHQDGQEWPLFSFFREDDGYRQSLFSVGRHGDSFAVTDVFPDRVAEALAYDEWEETPVGVIKPDKVGIVYSMHFDGEELDLLCKVAEVQGIKIGDILHAAVTSYLSTIPTVVSPEEKRPG